MDDNNTQYVIIGIYKDGSYPPFLYGHDQLSHQKGYYYYENQIIHKYTSLVKDRPYIHWIYGRIISGSIYKDGNT